MVFSKLSQATSQIMCFSQRFRKKMSGSPAPWLYVRTIKSHSRNIFNNPSTKYMDSNHGVLLDHFAHTKPKLLNRVAQYALITSNFHACEAETCSHRREGIAKSTNTITRVFQRIIKKFVDFSNQSCVAIQSTFWICVHHNWTYLAKEIKVKWHMVPHSTIQTR